LGKGGKAEIDETEEQRELAAIAVDKFNYAERELKPIRDVWLKETQAANDGSKFSALNGSINADVAALTTEQLTGTQSRLNASGVDPTSGQYQAALGDVGLEMASVGSETVNRAQSVQQDNYVAGLGNAVAMGEKKSMQAVDGLSDVAAKSADHARMALSNKLKAKDDMTTGAAALGTIGLDTALNGQKKKE
jgi:hypothetical protein